MRLLSVPEAKMKICKRAGVRNAPVILEDSGKPPTLVHLPSKGRGIRSRRVVQVGSAWLRENAPELAAAFLAARIQGGQ